MRKKIIIVLWSLLVAGILAAAGLIVAVWNGWVGFMPDVEDLQNPVSKFASQVYSADGKLIDVWRFHFDGEGSTGNRTINVEYDELSPALVKALVATEDERFYEHSGIDFTALMRAIVKRGIFQQKNAGGGSTLTQQLAKQLYTMNSGGIAKSTFERLTQKPQEWIIAVKLEHFYTKTEIITFYLNSFDFLNNATGIYAASIRYFNKKPKELTVPEAATLVGLCQNPSLYNPKRHPERCLERRNIVLSQMLKNGYITQSEYTDYSNQELGLHLHHVNYNGGVAPYFRDYIRRYMTAKRPLEAEYPSWNKKQYIVDSIAWVSDPLYGWCNKNYKKNGEPYSIYEDGLKIYTTIDSRMQRYAEEAVREHIVGKYQPSFYKHNDGSEKAPYGHLKDAEVEAILKRAMRGSVRYNVMKRDGKTEQEIETFFKTQQVEMSVLDPFYNGEREVTMTPWDSIRYYKKFIRCGFASMEPETGHVKAYVGGPNYEYFKYDMAGLGRRQVGSTAKPYLYSLAMMNGYKSCSIVPSHHEVYTDVNGSKWSPKGGGGGNITLLSALTRSDNAVSAWLCNELGPVNFVNILRDYGLTHPDIKPTLTNALGAFDSSPLEMVSGYSAFPNKGIRCAPIFVTKITDSNGNVLAEFEPRMNEVISPEAAENMIILMRGVINSGTGHGVRGYGLGGDLCGKTGTTNNNSDAWFMGYSPELVSGAWVGGDDRDIHGGMAQGASAALPIWARYMKKVYSDPTLRYDPTAKFDIAPEVLNCKNEYSMSHGGARAYTGGGGATGGGGGGGEVTIVE